MKRTFIAAVALMATACVAADRGREATGAQRLDEKLAALAAPGSLTRAAELDTVPSRAVSGLTYHVGRAMRGGYHDYVRATVAVREGRWFHPDSPSHWAPVLESWRPASPEVAMQLCKELVAIGPAGAPQRLVTNQPLELRDIEPLLTDDLAAIVRPLLGPGGVPAPSETAGRWVVDLWYPDFPSVERGQRIATHYRCTIPGMGASGHVPEVETVDSISFPSTPLVAH